MISQVKQKGFTIVELLIVIVVIAILAAISMAAYASITQRANNSSALAAAKSVKDVASAFNGNHGSWPTTKLAFTSGVPASGSSEPAIAKLPSDITFVTTSGAVTSATGAGAEKTVMVVPHGSPVAGFTITYRKDGSTTTTTVGDVSGTAGTAIANS